MSLKMKYLKIDASKDWGARYARALRHSPCILVSESGVEDDSFRLLYGSEFGKCIVQTPYSSGVMLWKTVLVPLHSAVVDPWVMAKYSMEGRSYYYGSDEEDDKSGPCFGYVDKVDDTFVLIDLDITTEVEEDKIEIHTERISEGALMGVELIIK